MKNNKCEENVTRNIVIFYSYRIIIYIRYGWNET